MSVLLEIFINICIYLYINIGIKNMSKIFVIYVINIMYMNELYKKFYIEYTIKL